MRFSRTNYLMTNKLRFSELRLKILNGVKLLFFKSIFQIQETSDRCQPVTSSRTWREGHVTWQHWRMRAHAQATLSFVPLDSTATQCSTVDSTLPCAFACLTHPPIQYHLDFVASSAVLTDTSTQTICKGTFLSCSALQNFYTRTALQQIMPKQIIDEMYLVIKLTRINTVCTWRCVTCKL